MKISITRKQEQFINSNPCAYAFYDQRRYNSAISIVTRFFFKAFPEISLFIQYGSYIGSIKQKMLWPHIEANEFKYISSLLHDCIADYGYDSITVHDAVYMGENDYKDLTSKGLDISDLFEAIIDKNPSAKYPARINAKLNESLFDTYYIDKHDVSNERIMFKNPDDPYEKERNYIQTIKSELKTKYKHWIFDPLWERNQKDKRRAAAYRKIQTHLKHYLNDLIADDYINDKYKDFFNNIEKYNESGITKISKTYSSLLELEKDFYNENGFIQKCKKEIGGLNTYSINNLTVTFGSIQSPIEKMANEHNMDIKSYKNKLLNEYKLKFSALLEKRREELKDQYFSELKVDNYARWKADHPKEAIEREHAINVMIDESSIATFYGTMLKSKWDPEKDAEKYNIFKEIKEIKKQLKEKQNIIKNDIDIFSL